MLLYNLQKAGCEVGFFVFHASRMVIVGTCEGASGAVVL